MRYEHEAQPAPFKEDSKIEKGSLLEVKMILNSFLAKAKELESRFGITPDLADYEDKCRKLVAQIDSFNERLTKGEHPTELSDDLESFTEKYKAFLRLSEQPPAQTLVMLRSDPSVIPAPGTDTIQ